MEHRLLKRIAIVLLCLCLLPSAVLAEEPVTESRFTLQLGLHADGFPETTSRLRDWEAFLGKIGIQGYAHTMKPLEPDSRVYMNASVTLNGRERLPFIYDGYHSYRYVISPAIKNDSLFFQMHNFFEFMLKPYYYMDLPTQYLALILYPEAANSLAQRYYAPIAEALEGEGSRHIPYEDLYELCETLDLLVTDDPHYQRMEMFVTCLLAQTYTVESTLASLGALEDTLDFLDPGQEGMTITVEGGKETYVLGDTTLFKRDHAGDAFSLSLYLPGPDGYLLSFLYDWTPAAQGALVEGKVAVHLEEEEMLSLALTGSGLPCEGDTQGEGRVTLTLGGSSFEKPLAPQTMAFRWQMEEKPEQIKALTLDLDWLHPTTERPALSLHYTSDMKEADESVFVEGAYPQLDFFSLNEGFLEEYKEKYASSLVLALTPFLLEMPAGVLDDIVELATQTGILESMGF